MCLILEFIIRVCSTLLDYEYGLETTNADNITTVSSGNQFASQQCFISQFEDPQEPGVKIPSYTCYCDDKVGCNKGNKFYIYSFKIKLLSVLILNFFVSLKI